MASAFDRTSSRRGPALWRALMAVGVVAALVPGAFGWGFGVSVVNNAPRYSIVPTPGAFGWEYMDTPSTSPAALTGVSGTTFGFNFKCSGGFSSSTSVLRLGYDVTCPDGVYTWRIAVQLYCRHELWSTTWDSPASVSVSAPAGNHPCAVFSVPIDVHGSPQGLGEGQTLVVTITDFGPPPPPHAYAHAARVRPVSTPCGPAPSDPVLYAEQSQPLVNGPCQGRYLSPTATQSECVELHGRCCSREKGGVGVSAVSNALPCGFCYASPPALLHQHLGAGEPSGANANAGVPPAPLVGCSCQTTFIGTCNLRANTCAAGTRPQCTYEGAKKYCTCACVH